MSTLLHEKPSQSPLRKILEWCRARIKSNSESEFGCCCDAEIERMARDIRMSPSELRAVARRGTNSADLLPRRMAALDLDPNEVGRINPPHSAISSGSVVCANHTAGAQGISRATRRSQHGRVTVRIPTRWRRSMQCPGGREASGNSPWPKNWEEGMNAKQIESVTRKAPPLPADWGRLIQKLRWIGLNEDATRLKSAVCHLPPEERRELICTPVETD